jgi:hypothetical protein
LNLIEIVHFLARFFTATVYSLSPVLTMSFAASFGIEQMTIRRSAETTIGLLGMLALVQQQMTAIDFGQTAWVIFGLLIPACAALDIIIR